MKEKKKSAVSWILTWAGQKRIAYAWSVLLAIGNVIFKIFPYFIIADVVKLFLTKLSKNSPTSSDSEMNCGSEHKCCCHFNDQSRGWGAKRMFSEHPFSTD